MASPRRELSQQPPCTAERGEVSQTVSWDRGFSGVEPPKPQPTRRRQSFLFCTFPGDLCGLGVVLLFSLHGFPSGLPPEPRSRAGQAWRNVCSGDSWLQRRSRSARTVVRCLSGVWKLGWYFPRRRPHRHSLGICSVLKRIRHSCQQRARHIGGGPAPGRPLSNAYLLCSKPEGHTRCRGPTADRTQHEADGQVSCL